MIKEILLEKIVSSFTAEIAKSSTSKLGVLKSELSHFIDDGLAHYLEKQKKKFSHIKTLLHRTTPVYFYDIFQPTRLICDTKKIQTDSVNKVFWESQFITVIGDAGSGKSTLVKHLFLNCISEKFCIPILIELRDLNDYKDSIESFIREKIFENKLSANNRILENLLSEGKFVFFLDGYDEIKSTSKGKIITQLNSFIDKYRKNRFLLTSRPFSNIELLPLFHNYHIDKLNDAEIEQFIKKQNIDYVLSEKITKSIKENKIQYIKSYLANPLLLSLYILTFSSNSSIPNKKYIFYRRVLDVLFKEHDSITKIGYDRELLTGLNQEQFEVILKVFSFLSYFDNEYDFEKDYLNKKFDYIKTKIPSIKFSNNNFIDDLKSSIALWTEDGGIISFAHRSMQEYFAALYVHSVNDNNTENVYSKISAKLFSNKSRSEINNFLSLLDEMDTFNYRKFILYPAIQKIYPDLKKLTKSNQYLYCLGLIFNGIQIRIKSKDGGKGNVNISIFGGKNRKSLFFIEQFEMDLVHQLFKIQNNKTLLDYLITNNIKDELNVKFSKRKDEGFEPYSIDFQKKLSPPLAKMILGTEIKKTIDEMIKYVFDLEKSTSKYIEVSSRSEKDFIDLI